jgi:hypothetical protein
VATEHHTAVAPLDVQWVPLADVLRHVITLRRAPEADIRSEIIEAIASGKLPHFVERTTKYLPRLFVTNAVASYPTDAPKEQPLKIEVRHNEPMPPEMLERGKVGQGSLYIDWQKSRAIRRAGLTWSRIEFEGIRCSREHMLALWPHQVVEPIAPTGVSPNEAGMISRTQINPFRTGGPGRPTASHIVKQEAERRISKGEITPKRGELALFARTLAEWWNEYRKKFDPSGPVLTAKTIENIVRELWKSSIKPK